MWPMVGTVTSRMGMNGTELKEEEAGISLGGCCGEEERPPVVDCHLTKEQGIPPGVIFISLVTKEYPPDTHLTKEHIATFLSLAHIESFNLRHSHILWQNICRSKSKAEVCWDNYGGIDTLQQQDCIGRISEDLVLMLTL